MLSEKLETRHISGVVLQSVLTASLVAISFLVFDQALLKYLSISISDFTIAGGLLLLTISFADLLTAEKRQRRIDTNSLGAVPLGIPLIVGPAVLTTSLLLANDFGKMMTSLVLIGNIALAGGLFFIARPITKILGVTGSKVLSKISSLFLAAIAVMLIRRGLFEWIYQTQQ